MSKPENFIRDLLTKEHIKFEQEKTFNDLKHGTYRYDFYLYDVGGRPCIIEYQGQQHYEYIAAFYKNRVEWK